MSKFVATCPSEKNECIMTNNNSVHIYMDGSVQLLTKLNYQNV